MNSNAWNISVLPGVLFTKDEINFSEVTNFFENLYKTIKS